MDILKKALLIIALTTSSIPLLNATTVVDCFRDSYEQEQRKEYKEAIASLKRIKADIYAKNLRLGWLYYLLGSYKVSEIYYTKAINMRPNSIESRLGFVLPAAKLKDWGKVGQQYDAILRIDPKNYKANYYRGLMYYNMGNFHKAAEYLNRLEELYPFDYDAVILCAWNTYSMKNYKKAKALFYIAEMINPDSKSAIEGMSKCK